MFISNLGQLSGLAFTLLHLLNGTGLVSSLDLHDLAVDGLFTIYFYLLGIEESTDEGLVRGVETREYLLENLSRISGHLGERLAEDLVAGFVVDWGHNLVKGHLELKYISIRFLFTTTS